MRAIEADLEHIVTNMDHQTFARLNNAVQQSHSTDYSREFALFVRARDTFARQAQNNGREAITNRLQTARVAAAADQRSYDILRPLNDQLQAANSQGRISTYTSRVVSAAVGALAAGGLALSLGGTPKI